MSSSADVYDSLGVASNKGSVREAFLAVVRQDFPGAFCNIVRDPWTPGWVMAKHADGTGSKTLTRLIFALETGSNLVFQGDTHDALAMNTGDIAASGFVFPPYVVTDTIGINSGAVPKDEFLQGIATGMGELKGIYEQHGLPLLFMGGETADLPDQLRSVTLDMDVFARMPAERVIDGNVRSGDVIFGFQSYGQAVWETRPNSGHMSNGSTLTRHVLVDERYGRKYPHLFREEKLPQGKFGVADEAHGLDMPVWEAMMSPTRQWAIVARMLIEELVQQDALHLLHAMVMNTGGGLTKCIHVGQNILYDLAYIPKPPPIFRLIQHCGNIRWEEMVRTYNCGIGFVVIGSPVDNVLQNAIEQVARKSAVAAYFLGTCWESSDKKNHVRIHVMGETFEDPHQI